MTPQPVRIGKMSESELNEIAKESYRQITGKQPPATAPNGTISTCDVSILHGSCPICPQHLTCKNPQKRIIQQQPAACGAGRHEVREDGIERHSGDGAPHPGTAGEQQQQAAGRRQRMTPERQLSIIVGCMMGGIHGLILWTSYVSFSLASYILYGDINILPLATTGICDLAMVACVLLMNWWMPRVEDAMVMIIESSRQEPEDEDEL